MDGIFPIAAISVTAAMLAILIKKQEKALGLLISLAAAALMMVLCADFIKSVSDFISDLAALAGMTNEILSPVLKTVGIGIVTKLCSQVCRDAGEGAIATLTDFAGTAAALFVSIPLMKAVIEMVTQML